MISSLSRFVTRHPWPVIVLFVVVTVLMGKIYLPQAEVDPEVKNQLPEDFASRVTTDKIEELFGGTEVVAVVLMADDVLAPETLKRLRKISNKMDRMPKYFDRVMSPFTLKDIRSEDDTLYVDPAVMKIPTTKEKREILRQQIKDNDLVYGRVISEDFKAAAVTGIMTAGASDSEVLGALQKVLDEAPGPEKLVVYGMPWVRVNLSKDIKGDMQRFLPYGLLIMLIFLYFCFKQLRGVILPFLVVILSIVFSMSLIPLFGWKIQMITVILPVMLIAVANDYGIHILAKYQEENTPGNTLDKKTLVRKVIDDLGKPVIFTGITTMAGMLCLWIHIIVPAKQMGLLASLGVIWALIGSLTFIPAVLVLLPKAKPIAGLAGDESAEGKRPLLERLLQAVARLVTHHPGKVIVGTFLLVGLTSLGIFRLVVDTNPTNYYPEDSPIVTASRVLSDNFGGAATIMAVAKGDIKDPKIMGQIDSLHRKLEKHPDVGMVTSIAEVARELNQTMHEDDPAYDVIPESRDLTAQYFLLYENSGEPEDFEKLVDFDYQHAQITARIRSEATSVINRVYDAFLQFVSEPGHEAFILVGGYGAVFSELVEGVVHGQVYSLAISLLVVAVLMMILFRSVMAGLLSMVPLALAMLLLFGIMGIVGIELNIATAMLSSIMIGVGIDYTIHFLWRYREERSKGVEHRRAVFVTLTTTGRGIVFNALSVVIGFVVLVLSNFLPVKFFGILVVVSISACLVGALMLLPAFALVFKPKFLEPKQIEMENKSDSSLPA